MDRLKVTVYPDPAKTGAPPIPPGNAGGSDPYGDFDSAPPTKAAPADPYADFDDKPPPKREGRQVDSGESFARGAVEGATFGAAPALAGLQAAGFDLFPKEVQELWKGTKDEHKPHLAAMLAGAARLGWEALTGHDEGLKAYRARRDELRQEQEDAAEQNPKSYMGGQLTGAILTPGGAAKGATAMGRIGSAALRGAATGAATGVGTGISEGDGVLGLAGDAAGGAATGAVFGTAARGLSEGAGKAISKGRRIIGGAVAPDQEAARQVRGAITEDLSRPTRSLTPEAGAAAARAGMPLGLIDAGGQKTRDLARTVANNSSHAWETLEKFTGDRQLDQHQRIAGTINRLFGHSLDSAAGDEEKLKAAARLANRPAYAKAYAAGDRPIWSEELERISGTPAMHSAMVAAVQRGQNRAVADGFGAFNPGVTVTKDGRISFPRGKSGVPTYPNIQFWDYVQRELRNQAGEAGRAGRSEEAGAIGDLHKMLRKELDKQVPEFGEARGVAAKFFGAEDASEAGRNFVKMADDPRDAARALAKMSGPERELFARGFADELAQTILKIPDKLTVIGRAFVDSPRAREKILLALGPDRARELEALLRAETVAQRTKSILGNSTTARQLKQLGISGAHGVGGAGAVAAIETARETDLDPKSIIGTALIYGSLRHGAHKLDERVAKRIAELLVSDDTSILRKGVSAVARSSQLFDALRNATTPGYRAATGAAARIGAEDVGGRATLAAGITALQHIISEGEDSHHAHDDPYQFAQ